jgi:hypothetical protein
MKGMRVAGWLRVRHRVLLAITRTPQRSQVPSPSIGINQNFAAQTVLNE